MVEQTRTFLAVELPGETREAIEHLQGRLRGEAPGLRWTAPDRLHLTLAFLGDVPTADLDRLGDAVTGAVAPLPRFELIAEGLGAFPTPKRPRVLWVGAVGDRLDALETLYRAVRDAVAEAGHPPADDRFHPHITIARAGGARGGGRPPDLAETCERRRSWKAGPLLVAEVVTFASERTPRGPMYTPLRRSSLGAASP